MEKIDYEQEVNEALEFLNRMRAAPASVIPELVKMLGKFKGKNYMIEPNVQLQTQEGKEAVENAITFLSTQKAVKPYEISNFLSYFRNWLDLAAWEAHRLLYWKLIIERI